MISAETVKTDRPIRVKLEERFADTFILRDGQWKVVGKYYSWSLRTATCAAFTSRTRSSELAFFVIVPVDAAARLTQCGKQIASYLGLAPLDGKELIRVSSGPAIGVFEDSLDSTPVSFASIGPIARYLPST